MLDRIEDSKTGRLLPQSFHCEVPADRLLQAQATAQILGEEIYKRFPRAHYGCEGATSFALPTTTDPVEALLEDNAPSQAKVTFESNGGASGWNAPGMVPRFEKTLNDASQSFFGAPCGTIGQG